MHGEFEDVGDDAMVSPIEVPAILYLLDGAQNVAAERHGDSTRYKCDVDGLVRELAVAGSDGQDAAIEITWKAQFDDFGEPVENEPPDDDQVVELDDGPRCVIRSSPTRDGDRDFRAWVWAPPGTRDSMRLRACRVVALVAVAVVATLSACSDDDVNGPGGSPPTLYQETIHIDPTPTTAP